MDMVKYLVQQPGSMVQGLPPPAVAFGRNDTNAFIIRDSCSVCYKIVCAVKYMH